MAIHHHNYASTAKKHAKELRQRGLKVVVTQYSDKTYGVYAYKEN